MSQKKKSNASARKIRSLQDKISMLKDVLVSSNTQMFGASGIAAEMLRLCTQVHGSNDSAALTLKKMEALMLRLKISTKDGIEEIKAALE